jgi:hypothetical protein
VLLLRVLPGERLAGLRRRNFVPVIVAPGLAGSDDGKRNIDGTGHADGEENKGKGSCHGVDVWSAGQIF